jgi:S-formylglutathione hydrolase FrmB
VKKILCSLSLIMLLIPVMHARAGDAIIIDSKHYSSVFGEVRNFRIFLPPGYYDNPEKRYPVIYYYHGWSQRYFGSTSTPRADEGESNNGDNIANFVATHDVIVVKPDGYNRQPHEEYYLRPYNISPVETYRQFPLYFPELVKYIDSSFKTIPDRNHRAISGLSMGGFMTFWISGKYPHLVSAAGNFCGSAEFIVGPQNFPVEYRHIDMAKNYAGLNVRLNYGNKDFIRCYHRDMNRIWTQVMDNYEYNIYNAEHTTCGLGEMFEFIMNTFKNPPAKPVKWDHIDVYPEFEVWDYLVSSDREIAGFTILENVEERGFGCSVREFLPDGELMPFVRLSVTTAPLYEKNKLYVITDIDKQTLNCSRKNIRSDSSGRLKIETDGGIHEIGINKAADSPLLCVASAEMVNSSWAIPDKEVIMRLRILNKGLANAGNVNVVLSATRDNTKVLKNSSSYGNIDAGEIKDGSQSFTFIVTPDSIEIVKLKLTIRDGNNNEWSDHIEIPVRKDPPEIREFVIADGRSFPVASAGIDTALLFLGNGNGDGIANPGESLVLLVLDRGIYRRTELITADPYVNQNGINARMSDDWSAYDHVGGSAKYSMPLISSECPQNHKIEFLASYWLPDYPNHIIIQGKVTVRVSGKDITPPVIRWANVSGDNTVQAKAFDGSDIKQVRVRFTASDNPKRTFEVLLNDEGKEGDRNGSDRLFSKKIPEDKFGTFRIEIEALDLFENKQTEKYDGLYVLH